MPRTQQIAKHGWLVLSTFAFSMMSVWYKAVITHCSVVRPCISDITPYLDWPSANSSALIISPDLCHLQKYARLWNVSDPARWHSKTHPKPHPNAVHLEYVITQDLSLMAFRVFPSTGGIRVIIWIGIRVTIGLDTNNRNWSINIWWLTQRQ